MKRFIFPLAVSLCLLLVISQNTTVAAKDTWVSVRTKNFLMVGNANEKDIRKVGLKLEQFREVFTRLFPKLKFNTPVPTTVVVFKSDSSFAPFKPNANTAGYFQAGDDVNYIALTTEVRGQQDPFNVIFHEYTHLLVDNTFENAPVWFNEGLAEYYSTFSITDDQKVRLGTPIGNHVLLLRESKMLPLRTLFEVDHKSPYYNEGKKQSIFYAQSWALMHYLIIGKAGKVEQLGKFMELLRTKVPMEQAFQQAFETPFEVMEKDLRDYVKKDRYNVIDGHFEQKLALDTTTEATPLTEAEAQAYLGDLLLHSNRKDAYTYLEKAVKLDPNLAMAHASLGMAYFREGKINEANASFERAVAGDSKNYLAHYYYAFTLSRAGRDEGPTNTPFPPETAAKIREHLQKAIALRPDFPESYNLLAFVSLVTGQGVDESIAQMKRLLSISPGKLEYIYMLGQLYLHKEDYKMARELLEVVAKSNAEEQIRAHSEQLLKQLSAFEEAKAQVEEAKRNRPKGIGSEPVVTSGPGATKTEDPPTDPSSYLREVLRTPGAGETQLQAKLVRIECQPKNIVFVMQTANGLLRLNTKTFDDIEITTYDPKVAGEITCGARKPENTVVVCYLSNGVLKSIEFVPADFKLK
jgi:tetratricopeptide (TPR) repeat protein